MTETNRIPKPGLRAEQKPPKKAVIKKWAHAFTVFSVAWGGVSVMAAAAYWYGKAEGDDVWIRAAHWAWRIHVGAVFLTVIAWFFERPSEVRYCHEADDDETIR